jgi:hypothetical protein
VSEQLVPSDVTPASRELAAGLLREAEIMGLGDEVLRRLRG